MITELLQWDTELFLKIHRGLSNDFFDWILPLVRNRFFWSPLYLFIIIFCIKQYRKTGVYIIAILLLTFALGDGISSKLIKPNVGRLRPCNEPTLSDQIIRRVPCGRGKSFPSSHATNHFGIAVLLICIFYRKWRWILPLGLAWAFIISFAQVYVGVHYPVDTMFGAILGACIGFFTYYIFRKIQPTV
ncbi:MAG: phosphatase PAP2 family protein [Pedobacter sp.]|nr:MAG: phosphatase PAP2 family protein [Pedobacter sp.]